MKLQFKSKLELLALSHIKDKNMRQFGVAHEI